MTIVKEAREEGRKGRVKILMSIKYAVADSGCLRDVRSEIKLKKGLHRYTTGHSVMFYSP